MKVFVKFFNDAGEVVLVPVTDDMSVPHSWKPAETYKDAAKRNYRAPARRRFLGSVLLSGRS